MENRKIFVVVLLLCGYALSGISQQTFTYHEQLQWYQKEISISPLTPSTFKIWTISGSEVAPAHPFIPQFSKRFALPEHGKVTIALRNARYEAMPAGYATDEVRRFVQPVIEPYTMVHEERRRYFVGVNFMPMRLSNTGQLERLMAFDLEIRFEPGPPTVFKDPNTNFNSVLKDGGVAKVAIAERGIYRVDYDFLKNQTSIDIDNIDPRRLAVYGHIGGPLPEASSASRTDDLAEIPVLITGEADGRFDPSDVLFFYGEGPDRWAYNEANGQYGFTKNPYDTRSYFFIKVKDDMAARMESRTSAASATYESDQFDAFERYDSDEVNLLGQFGSASGSGQRWFGSSFANVREQDFSGRFRFDDVDLSQAVAYTMEFAGRSDVSTEVRFEFDGARYDRFIGSVKTGDVEALYARPVRIQGNQMLQSSNPVVRVSYLVGGHAAEGWLDYIAFQYRQRARFNGQQLIFRDLRSVDHAVSSFRLSSANAQTRVWDVSDPLNPVEQQFNLNGSQLTFGYASQPLAEFVAFDPTAIAQRPEFVEMVAAQNLHDIRETDMVILYHPDFQEAAERLADHRRSESGLTVHSVPVQAVYDEFAAGKGDPTAIRDFAKLLYDRSDRFRFLLLFGDGSYDFRNLTPGLADNDFIPAYQTLESLEPLKAFPTDDYFALLGDLEGDDLRGAIDIAVGRIPVTTAEEADAVVQKIIHYETNSATLGDWRLRLEFTSDDEDGNIHITDADGIARMVAQQHPVFNQEKVYFDAFKQESTPGGDRYPGANQKINDDIFRGLLILNYLGHGGPKGWSQERVLKISDINNWDNFDRLTLMVTATCSFTGFDDPAIVTAGESAILNPRGGAVGLFSTVRAVYASQNERLTRAVFDTIFTKPGGQPLALGESLRRAKNANSADTVNINARKFLLIGDPAMKLALPKYDVVTTQINGKAVDGSAPDTIRALQQVSIDGYVADVNGQVNTAFNGTIFPTVFDKPTTVQTLSNDDASPQKNFTIQKNVLFKGSASVVNGQFSFSFVVPIDINFDFGAGKISYYASDNSLEDAAGAFTGFIVGGTDPTVLADNEGPKVEVFMNNDAFVQGGITNRDPVLFAVLSDENGINVSGTSIGHDLTATLDENTQETFILNDFYTSDLNDFTRGSLRFPLNDLALGKHVVRVRAFDVANNPGEGYTEFFVTDSENSALEHVLNFPNPFTTSTQFMFEHDLANTEMDVFVRIYTVSGRLVKTIRSSVFSDGFRVRDIAWDGTDDFGSQLGRGVYMYKINVRAEELNVSRESNFEKLVILR